MAFSARVSNDVMASINVTPLVDVLLVLLIIFMITSPIVTHKTAMDLPQSSSKAMTDPLTPIHLAIHEDGQMYWNDTPIDQSQLITQLALAGALTKQPPLDIAAADGVDYDTVARVLANAKAQGIERINILGQF
jgi:biopolymer transport protein ExbD